MEDLNQEQMQDMSDEEAGLRGSISRPIPGQSFLNAPETPLPFEQPPEFTNYEEAQGYVFESIMDNSSEIVDAIGSGLPLTQLAQSILMHGFINGKWTPQLLLLLIEPTMYSLMFVAEVAGVDYVLSEDEEGDYLDADDSMAANRHLQEATKQVKDEVQEKVQESGSVASAMPGSLLAKGEQYV